MPPRHSWLNWAIARYLYLLRHAKSSWADPALVDEQRPLSARGERAARAIADHLARTGVRPELVLCSSASRARQTLKPISAALGLQGRTHFETGLYTATAEDLVARVRNIEPMVTSALLIGHNPALEDLARELAGDDPEILHRLGEKFPTGAMATVVHGTDFWAELTSGTAHITSLTYPRDLPY